MPVSNERCGAAGQREKGGNHIFYKHLKSRMGHFGMTLEESKTRRIEFGRDVGGKSGSRKHSHFWGLHTTVPVAGMVNSGQGH